MDAVDIIRRKRDGESLDQGAIDAFVRGAADASWPDYQLTAMLMAIAIRGMNDEETSRLTAAVAQSGDVARYDDLPGPKLDKHSTGGVGDKLSLVVAPLVAACGGIVPMMSGRGLGHTGGTVDKLEAIPGFRTSLAPREIRDVLRAAGCCITGPTAQVAPADARLYSLRDVTATVDSIPLITASILGKKLAEGLDGLVLDVKVGKGAFMQTEEDARRLAERLVDTGHRLGLQMEAVLTAMDAPLGRTVGNGLEVREAIETLRGAGPDDVRLLSLALAERMLLLGNLAASDADAAGRVRQALESGQGLARFQSMIAAQGGDAAVVEDTERLPRAPHVQTLTASASGTVVAMHARAVGGAAALLGAGRRLASDHVDPAAGILLFVKPGDRVEAGDALAELHGRDPSALHAAADRLHAAITIADHAAAPTPLLLARIDRTTARVN